MKGVDIVAEFEEAYVYVELKDYDDPSIYDVRNAANDEQKKARQDSFKWLKTTSNINSEILISIDTPNRKWINPSIMSVFSLLRMP